MNALRLTSVGVALGGRAILERIDLDVWRGQWLGIVGPNGAGKSTLLRAIAGAVSASGTIELAGTPVAALTVRERARATAFVPQRPEIPGGMTVVEYVLLGRAAHQGYLGVESREDLDAVHRAIVSLDLDSLANRRLQSLSGGELQRVVLARAVAQASPLMVLDEPTSALDVGHQQQLLALIDQMRATNGLTVISAIHDLTLAAQFCDRLVMLAGGTVVASGVASSVLTESSIHQHYGARVRILSDEDGGVVVIPVRDSAHLPRSGSMSANE